MKQFMVLIALTVLVLNMTGCAKSQAPVVVLETTEGTIEIELFPNVAPKHVENFLSLTREGFYDSVIFHRVIEGFMIQTGDPTGTGMGNSGKTLQAEFNDSLHRPGTVAMARSQDPNSASSQFYICLAATPYLDHQYTVFGKTIKGFDVVQKIGKLPTSAPMQRIMSDSTWRSQLQEMRSGGTADVALMPNGFPYPDRPLKKTMIIRAYEKK